MSWIDKIAALKILSELGIRVSQSLPSYYFCSVLARSPFFFSSIWISVALLSHTSSNKPGMTQVGAAPMAQNMHGDPLLGIIKFDDPWVYHKVRGLVEKTKIGRFYEKNGTCLDSSPYLWLKNFLSYPLKQRSRVAEKSVGDGTILKIQKTPKNWNIKKLSQTYSRKKKLALPCIKPVPIARGPFFPYPLDHRGLLEYRPVCFGSLDFL